MLPTKSPFPQFFALDGSPLTNGSLYFGQVGQNPLTAPATVYWDAAGTQPAAQPIKTLNGYPVRGGAPANIYTATGYSLTVLDQQGRIVAYLASVDDGVSSAMRPVLAAATVADARTALGAASLGANTFTGAQTLPGNAVNPLEAVPKQQAESIASAAAASAVSNRMQYSLTASQATTSGVAVDFTGIPSWASRITVLFDGVSTNGSDNIAVRLGTSAGVEASGYLGTTLYYLGTSSGAVVNIGTGISIFLGANTIFRSGALTLTRMSGNRWAFAGMIVDTVGAGPSWVAGHKPLAGVLDRLRITTNNGTDAFDAGAVSLLIEG
jgi:hypothetical protein